MFLAQINLTIDHFSNKFKIKHAERGVLAPGYAISRNFSPGLHLEKYSAAVLVTKPTQTIDSRVI